MEVTFRPRRVRWSIPELSRAQKPAGHPEKILKTSELVVSPRQTPGTFLERGCLLENGAFWHLNVLVHNRALASKMMPSYSLTSLGQVRQVLEQLGTLDVKSLPTTGLPQAGETRSNSQVKSTGYDNAWTRDAVFVSNSWLETGSPNRAARAVQALIRKYAMPAELGRMCRTLEGTATGPRGIDRPHIKFNANTLEELKVPWAHEQNDALGLFQWMSFRLARLGHLPLDAKSLEPLALLTAYLDKIDYATDKEAGHWEEMGQQMGRVQASSLRCAISGLQELRAWLRENPGQASTLDDALRRNLSSAACQRFGSFADGRALDALIDRGAKAFTQLLPLESDGEGIYRRTSDLAILSALYLDLRMDPQDRLISPSMQRTLVQRFLTELRGSHGDRRYNGDGYWGALKGETNSKAKIKLNDEDLEGRLRLLEKGTEAQWTLGTPLLSAIFGKMYEETGDETFLKSQTHELNRALGMVTGPESRLGEGTIPESYMQVRSNPKNVNSPWIFTENPLPLNWSKANLALAMAGMEKSLLLQAAKSNPPAPVLWQAA